jgi:hypothetical protein
MAPRIRLILCQGGPASSRHSLAVLAWVTGWVSSQGWQAGRGSGLSLAEAGSVPLASSFPRGGSDEDRLPGEIPRARREGS